MSKSWQWCLCQLQFNLLKSNGLYWYVGYVQVCCIEVVLLCAGALSVYSMIVIYVESAGFELLACIVVVNDMVYVLCRNWRTREFMSKWQDDTVYVFYWFTSWYHSFAVCSVNLLFQTLSEDSSFLLLLAYQRIRGFAFMRYINPRLTLTLTLFG